ncbi:MAG: insulinase family protein, partial [Planctomycetes bacterium]|nr:insulinase family protein [Planctomycetota bacterium]
HLLEHLHMSVTRSYPSRLKFLRAIDSIPGDVNAFTHPQYVQFHIDSPPQHVGRAAGLLTEILEARPYPDDIVDSEKQLVINEIKCSQEDVDARFVYSRLDRKHPLSRPPMGTKSSVSKLTRDQILGFDRKHFTPRNTVVVIAGPILESEIKHAKESLCALEAGETKVVVPPACPSMKLPRFRRMAPLAQGRQVIVGFDIPEPLPRKSKVVLRMLPLGLGLISCPLFEKSRYGKTSVYSFEPAYEVLGGRRIFYVHAVTNRGDRDAFLNLLLEEIEALKKGSYPESWLTLTRERYLYRVQRTLDFPESIAHRIGSGEICARNEASPLTMEQEVRIIREIEMQDLTDLLERVFVKKNFFLIFDANTRPFDERRVRRIVHKHL